MLLIRAFVFFANLILGKELEVKRILLVCLAILLMASTVNATPMGEQTVNYGWEDEGTILGNYYDITATNDNTHVHNGSLSLKIVDGGENTPQAYVGWVTGLANGDEVTASFWVYDAVSGSPSARIWGHYTSDPVDIDSYAGSASGNYTYSGDGWSQLSYTWTFDAGADRDGLVIEARTYSELGDTVWIDDLTITAPENATIVTPATVPVPAALWLMITGILGFVGYKRKKN